LRDARRAAEPAGALDNNIGVFQENLTSAESRIRPVDVAAEMVDQTKLWIVSQAGTAMLSQANQGAQNVLSLLR
jgi:flagellin